MKSVTELKTPGQEHSEGLAGRLLNIERDLTNTGRQQVETSSSEVSADVGASYVLAINAITQLRLRILKETGLSEWADLPV